MDLKINGKALLLGIFLTTSYTFADYVATIAGGYSSIQDDEPRLDAPYITKSSQSSDGGYNEWSNGYKEAWGQYNKGSVLINTDVININLPFTLSKPNSAYVNANIIGRVGGGDSTINIHTIGANSLSFAPDGSHTGTLAAQSFTWTVKGF